MAANWGAIIAEPYNDEFIAVVDIWKCRSGHPAFPDYLVVAFNRAFKTGESARILEVVGEWTTKSLPQSSKYGRPLERPFDVVYEQQSHNSQLVGSYGRVAAASPGNAVPFPWTNTVVGFTPGFGLTERLMTPVFDINAVEVRFNLTNTTQCYRQEQQP